MWLPRPIYESLPTIYMVIGLLFLAGAIYLGLVHEASIAYAGIGIVCFLSGLFIRERRREARDNKKASSGTSDDQSDRG